MSRLERKRFVFGETRQDKNIDNLPLRKLYFAYARLNGGEGGLLTKVQPIYHVNGSRGWERIIIILLNNIMYPQTYLLFRIIIHHLLLLIELIRILVLEKLLISIPKDNTKSYPSSQP